MVELPQLRIAKKVKSIQVWGVSASPYLHRLNTAITRSHHTEPMQGS